jgi:hypothetical protein
MNHIEVVDVAGSHARGLPRNGLVALERGIAAPMECGA